ncbi:MAG: AAA family ATPase [Planctomycetes bacterium]|nr:AAA family ATPase [Planctomycetota bacterium]
MNQVDEAKLERHRSACDQLRARIAERFLGAEDALEQLLLCLLAGGNALIEGAPGLGKTTLVRAVAAALGMDFRRVQFTPDLMPADILGARLLEEDDAGRRHFRFQEGPIFTHVLLADEVNRATPRTQSALLEAMQEHQVTVFGETRPLPDPFFVIATQNPLEMEGTYPLPEAQLDRFLLKIDVAAPSADDLVRILEDTHSRAPSEPDALLDAARVLEIQALVDTLPASKAILRRIARLVRATHADSDEAPDLIRRCVRHGASPRGGQAILLAARSRAFLAGRLHVTDDDLDAVAAPALRHRILLGYEGEASGVRPDALVAAAVEASRG